MLSCTVSKAPRVIQSVNFVFPQKLGGLGSFQGQAISTETFIELGCEVQLVSK